LRKWWLVFLTAVTAAGASLLLTSVVPPQYRSTVRLMISPNLAVVEGSDVLRSLDTLDRATIVTTYAEVLESSEIRNRARQEMQLAAGDLEGYAVDAVRLPEANVLEISVTGENPRRVQALAEAVAEVGMTYIEEVYPVYDISLLNPAALSLTPISPKPLRNALVASVLGAAVGVLLALLLSREALVEARREAWSERQQPGMPTVESRIAAARRKQLGESR
jgi:capsular polysaccharide biosynthesis protein